MIRLSHGRTAATVLCIVFLAACGQDADRSPLDTRGVPGTLTVVLTSPRADVGAISLVLRGSGIGAPVSADPDLQLFLGDSDPGSDEVRLAIVGESLSGPVVRFAVPDIGAAAAYSVELVSVADRSNAVQEDLSSYAVRIVTDG